MIVLPFLSLLERVNFLPEIMYTAALAEKKRRLIFERIRDYGLSPHLAVVLVGQNQGSMLYVSHKQKACQDVGIQTTLLSYPDSVPELVLLVELAKLNARKDIHGILVQLPLPAHISTQKVLQKIDPKKDVDGLTIHNQGCLSLGLGGFLPCTPMGIMEMIHHYRIPLAERRAVVIGRSSLVGAPMARLLCAKNATVTTIHSHTKNPKALAQEADVLIVACGQPLLVDDSWVKPGAAVIDVGIHKGEKGLVGDVNFDQVLPLVSHISPVPGGVGPMTIASLLDNCLKAYDINTQPN